MSLMTDVWLGLGTAAYRLERVGVEDVDEAAEWLRWWFDVDPVTKAAESACIWVEVSPARRRKIVRDWLRLRLQFHRAWRERGGCDAL